MTFDKGVHCRTSAVVVLLTTIDHLAFLVPASRVRNYRVPMRVFFQEEARRLDSRTG